MIASGLFMQSCNKDQDVQKAPEGEFQFTITQTDFDFKGTDVLVPECLDLSMDYVKFNFNGVDYTSPVMFANGSFLTKTVKLAPGTYNLTEFLVYHDAGVIGDESDDVLIKAAPAVNSEYWDLMENPLDLAVTIDAFKKVQKTIDVLCFEDLVYQQFGFTWFNLNQVKIERQCFFGDVCTGKVYEYENSLYESQANGLQMDMPAIMEIVASKYDSASAAYVPFRTFSNAAYFGEGQCLEVYWANDEDLVEDFRFELYVLLPQGLGMAYQLVGTYDFQDEDTYDFQDEDGVATGADGVVDFVLGNCSLVDADFTYPAWVNLPSGSFTMHVDSVGNMATGNAAPHGTYFDITLSGIAPGYDIFNGTFGSFCGDKDQYISVGSTHTVNIASSLYPLPEGINQVTSLQLERMNYMFNNLHLYPGFEAIDLDDFTSIPEPLWADVQNAIWFIVGDIADPGLIIATDAINNVTLTNGYAPLPGGWATVVFFVDGAEVQIQLMPLDP